MQRDVALIWDCNICVFSTPTPTPAANTCLCKAILKQWYYYAMHITIAFACSQLKLWQFHFTSSVNMLLSFSFPSVSFADISKQMHAWCLWLLGSEETESDPVCLCDNGAKIIPLWYSRVGKVEKLLWRVCGVCVVESWSTASPGLSQTN